jgi:hypothetical protein
VAACWPARVDLPEPGSPRMMTHRRAAATGPALGFGRIVASDYKRHRIC